MKVRGKTCYVFDIEIFKNAFHCAIRNSETSELFKFEISIRKNQLEELVQFFLQKPENQNESNVGVTFVGYNNIHYDNVIINYMIDYQNLLSTLDYTKICNSLFNLSNTIISSTDDTSAYMKWKNMHCFDSIDLLTMLYSKKLRVGLKSLQVTMQYNNVQEYVHDWKLPLEEYEIDEMIQYNINDVDSTLKLLNLCDSDIKLRIAIEDEYNVNVINKDSVNIGMEIISKKYLEATHKHWNEIKDLRSPVDFINLNDIILPFITYSSPELVKMLNTLRLQTISPNRKSYKYKFLFKGLVYNVGVGGLHSVNEPEIIKPKDDEYLIDIDVASLYPSMILEYKFYPKHLGEAFLDIYARIRKERLEAKHNKQKLKNITLKFALNGLSGNLQNEYSFCYSPVAVMQVRINGQLLLLMLAEKLLEVGCKIIQANTDGLFLIVKKDKYAEYTKAYKQWEELTHLTLEETKFEAMYQYAINDYIAVKEGYKAAKAKYYEELLTTKQPVISLEMIRNQYIEEKGMFITKVILGKGLSPKIIPEAVRNYLTDNIPITDTIYGCTDIKKFLMSVKVSKEYSIEYNNKLIQHINRFYASTNGAYLYRCKINDQNQRHSYTNLLTASGVTILNKFNDDLISTRNINYNYYIAKCYEICETLSLKQLSLWQ